MQQDIFKKIGDWLAKPGNTLSKLAVALNLQSTNAIANWFYRGKIPEKHIKDVENFLRKN